MEQFRSAIVVALAMLLGASTWGASIQGPLEIKQSLTPYNMHSGRGMPISTTTNVPPGSDGRAPTILDQEEDGLPTTLPTTGQFIGATFFGGGVVPTTPQNLNTNQPFAEIAANIGVPLARSNGVV